MTTFTRMLSSSVIKRHNNLMVCCLLTGLFACNTNVGRQEHGVRQAVSPDSVVLTAASQRQEKNEKVESNSDCIRGQAEPVLRKEYFPTTTFVLQSDSLTAVETASIDNGDKLVVTNWGCEYYVLTFRFETSRFKADTSNLKYWYVAGGKLMNEIQRGINAPIDIKKGVQAFTKHLAENSSHLKLQTEIDFGGEEIRDYVTLDSITKTQHGRFAVVVSFVTGPL
ncbi:hypothetical protein HHL22_00680 [Hymenobacter sp. RP-2-7]|uniref:Lipoprotein n=1 Tax=Hymenobacter polaris TaxID=2682546 RepID=A0A7Y0AAD2_9BACT|nr:hypothetical protein [Hymenobacter polaris]NML63714.1 hypothetical protein [Hymenobacter polaris]